MLEQAPGNGQVPPENLPKGTASDVITDVVEHNTLLRAIANQRISYADNSIIALLPSGFATLLEVHPAQQLTPPLPSPTVPVLAFLGVGLLLALAVPILRDRLDHSVRSAQVAAGAFDAPVLTTIPHVARRFRQTLAEPGTEWDGAYRALAATSVATDRLPEAIVVTSPTGTIQDTVAANFAAALAGLGLRVALIASEPRQAWFLDEAETTSPDLSFPDLLELAHQGRLNGALPRGLLKTSVQNLYVLHPGEPGRDVGLDGLRPLLEAFHATNLDVTVIAGPALLEDPDATIFAWTTRSVLWAFEAGEVTEAEAREAATRLALAGVTPFGVAMVSEA
jgi:Mrp family chromosome partitioning ATPase